MASAASFTLGAKTSHDYELGEDKGIAALSKSLCNQLCMQVYSCIFNAPLWTARATADPICTPSPPALSLTHKRCIRHKRVNDSFCFVAGSTTKANDNNKSIKLSSSEHISSFRRPTRGLKCTHIARWPPKQQAALGLAAPRWPERT